MVSLWHMLVVMTGSTVFLSAMAAQRLSGGGAAGLALAGSMGIALGLLSMYFVSKMGRRLMRSICSSGMVSSRIERRLRILYAAVGVSIVVLGFLAFEATLASIRLSVPAANLK